MMRVFSARTHVRPVTPGVLGLGLALALAASACGGSSTGPSASVSTGGSTTTKTTVAGVSCTTAAASHGADKVVAVVVEPSATTVISRCLDVGAGGLSGVEALHDARVEVGTQQYSFGLGICQVDDVPAHYVACLPSGKPYWALFTATGTGGWVSASTGISDVTVRPGDSLGLRYDSPKGNPAPPSVAPPLK